MKRTTIRNEVSLSGIGLHKGEVINFVMKPNIEDNPPSPSTTKRME